MYLPTLVEVSELPDHDSHDSRPGGNDGKFFIINLECLLMNHVEYSEHSVGTEDDGDISRIVDNN